MQRKETDAPPLDDSVMDEENVKSSMETLTHGPQNVLRIRIIKTAAILLFLCGLIGAFIYAVNSTGESSSEDTSGEFNSTDPYSVLKTQYSTGGKFIFEIVIPPDNRILSNGSSFWYQDHEKKELIYKKDNTTVVWVYPTRSFWATINENGDTIQCKEDYTVGYDSYIKQLSLTNMYNRHSEKRQMKGNTKVYVFEGDPIKWEHEKVQPYLIQAFAATNDGRLMEFQSYYDNNNNNGWSYLAYTFYDMKSDKPPAHTYSDLPNNCEPSG